MHINKSKRPSLLYIECKSRDLSRRNSRISQNDTMNKENSNYQSIQLLITAKKIDRTMGSMNKMYKQAIQDQMCLQEQAQMLIEDLNGKLLQRVELIGQVEELEELIEYHKIQSNFEFQFATKIDKLESQIQQLKKQSSFKLTDSTADLIRDREMKHKELKERIHQETNCAMQQFIKQWGQQFVKIKQEYGNEIQQSTLENQTKQFKIILILLMVNQLNVIKQNQVQNLRNNLLEDDPQSSQLQKEYNCLNLKICNQNNNQMK